MANNTSHVVWFEDLRRADVPRVGGKNASLGEMVANLATNQVRILIGLEVAGAGDHRMRMQGGGDPRQPASEPVHEVFRLVIISRRQFRNGSLGVGGAEFELKEEDPMLGFRGASRYYSPRYREGFALECCAIRRLRWDMGFKNVVVMIPFCRSTKEADRVLEVLAENDLKRGEDGIEVYVRCEIPSDVILAKAFAERFDGFSIGSNDLTQLTLGVDRDSSELAELFDEQDDAVKWMIRSVIGEAHKAGAKVGLCGQAPSDHPEFAEFLVQCGIDSMSVSPDSFIAVKRRIAATESTPGSSLNRSPHSASPHYAIAGDEDHT
jgi:phosphoenolpyruvate synthase/pyruvate phosphate dikinase